MTIRKYSHEYPVRMMCRLLNVSMSGYYAFLGRPISNRERENTQPANKIKSIYDDHKSSAGSPRITKCLEKEGIKVGKNRVARIMRNSGWRAKAAKKYKATTNSNHKLPVADNLLKQDFSASRENEKWVSDISVPQQSGIRDGSRSPITGLQGLVINHRKRHLLRAFVVSVTEKVQYMYQVWNKKTNISESPFKCRK